jgi:hypothetical protein
LDISVIEAILSMIDLSLMADLLSMVEIEGLEFSVIAAIVEAVKLSSTSRLDFLLI